MKTRLVATSAALVAAFFAPLVYDHIFGPPDPNGVWTVAILGAAWALLTIGTGFLAAECYFDCQNAMTDEARDRAVFWALLRVAGCFALIGLTRPFFLTHPALILVDLVVLLVLARTPSAF